MCRCFQVLLPAAVAILRPVADLAVGGEPSSTEVVRTAISRAIPLLEEGMRGSADQRTCFTCHNQAVPLLALAEARKRGFPIDADNFDRQVRHTYEHLERGRKSYLEGRGQGGQVITAGYLIDTQLEDGSWHVATRAKPFQIYFESGFPHDEDQFISIAASGWATLALTLTIPETP